MEIDQLHVHLPGISSAAWDESDVPDDDVIASL